MITGMLLFILNAVPPIGLLYVGNHIVVALISGATRLRQQRYFYAARTTLQRCVKKRMFSLLTFFYALLATFAEAYILWSLL